MLTSKWERPAWTQKVRHRVQACKRPHRRQVGRPTRLASINQLNTADVCNLLPRVTSPQRDYSAMACVEMLRCRHMNAPRQVWAMPHCLLVLHALLSRYLVIQGHLLNTLWPLSACWETHTDSRADTAPRSLFPSSSGSISAVGAVGCSSKPQVN